MFCFKKDPSGTVFAIVVAEGAAPAAQGCRCTTCVDLFNLPCVERGGDGSPPFVPHTATFPQMRATKSRSCGTRMKCS